MRKKNLLIQIFKKSRWSCVLVDLKSSGKQNKLIQLISRQRFK